MKILFLSLFLIATYMQNNKFENITRTGMWHVLKWR